MNQLEKKVKMDKDPDMAGCESWMRDALDLAEEVIGMGEGDLLELGDFHQVEYMVRFLSETLLIEQLSIDLVLTYRSILYINPLTQQFNSLANRINS